MDSFSAKSSRHFEPRSSLHVSDLAALTMTGICCLVHSVLHCCYCLFVVIVVVLFVLCFSVLSLQTSAWFQSSTVVKLLIFIHIYAVLV